MTQEARVRLDQVSPSTVSGDRPNSLSPSEEAPKPKKTQNPLPPTPTIKEEVNNEDDEEENPYDIAETDKNRSPDTDNGLNVSTPLATGRLGSYAKVSRHSGSEGNGYAEVIQVRHPPIGRVRSSTEPIEPLPPLPPVTKSRTLSGNETSHMPLPLPPTGTEEKPYDSIGNVGSEILRSIMDGEKVYDSLDNDDNEMYESVPEELKEELVGITQSVPLPPRSPKEVESFSGTPSPTKPVSEMCPDSPKSKKVLKKAAKKKNSNNEDDSHKPKISLLNRFRSSSTSPGMGKNKKDKRAEFSLASPDHSHLSQPIPLPPLDDNDDNDDDMYDSVDPVQILDIKARSGSLPVGLRSSMLFNPRFAEPLPEVPEDSGSGSKGVLVTRDRHLENDDPNYDIVVGAMKEGISKEDESDEEDTYDVVRPREERSISNPQPPPPHSYAKVTGHTPMTRGASVDHDDKGYAIVDPSIVMRKRAASLTKQKSEDTGSSRVVNESPYDRVKVDGEEEETQYDEVKRDMVIDEPPYDKGSKDESPNVESPYDKVGKCYFDDEPPYDKVTKDESPNEEPPYDKGNIDESPNEESPNDKVGKCYFDDEPPYDKVTKDESPNEEPPYDKGNIDESPNEESPYDKVGKCYFDDEPPYDKVTKDESPNKEPPYDKETKEESLNEEPPYDKEPPYDRVESGRTDDIDRGSTDDPDYATVTTKQLVVEEGNKQESSLLPSTFNFTTQTVQVEDVTYSHVDLAKKHSERKLKQEQLSAETANTSETISTVEETNMSTLTSSPIDEFSDSQPPPIPTYLIDSSGTISPEDIDPSHDTVSSEVSNLHIASPEDVDPNYDTVGLETIKPTNLHTNSESISPNEHDIEISSTTGNKVAAADHSEQLLSMDTLSSEESHIYDNIEDESQPAHS